MEWEQMNKKHIKKYYINSKFDFELHIHGIKIKHTESRLYNWKDLEIAIKHFKLIEGYEQRTILFYKNLGKIFNTTIVKECK